MYHQPLGYAAAIAIGFATCLPALLTKEHLPKARDLVKRALPVFDWDDTLPNAAIQKEKASEAWFGMLTLADRVYNKDRYPNRWPRIYNHYFSDADETEVDKVFKLLVGEGETEDPEGGAAFMQHIFITNRPVPQHLQKCENEPRLAAFAVRINVTPPDPVKYIIRICDFAYKFPVRSSAGCDALGDKVSGMMDTLDAIILHEMMHIDDYVGNPAIGEGIVDHGERGYGPVNVRAFKDNPINSPKKNADNYRIYAQELFWTEMCNKEFGDATDNRPYPDLDPPTNVSPPPPPPPAAKINALSIIFQKTLDEIGEGHDWLFFPGKQGESMLCHSQKDSWHFTSKVGMNKDGTAPWPTGTFQFDSLFGRSCDYKNDGKNNPGMLWCKEKDGKDIGIQCFADEMRATKAAKQCTKSGLIPFIEHVAVVYCEW